MMGSLNGHHSMVIRAFHMCLFMTGVLAKRLGKLRKGGAAGNDSLFEDFDTFLAIIGCLVAIGFVILVIFILCKCMGPQNQKRNPTKSGTTWAAPVVENACPQQAFKSNNINSVNKTSIRRKSTRRKSKKHKLHNPIEQNGESCRDDVKILNTNETSETIKEAEATQSQNVPINNESVNPTVELSKESHVAEEIINSEDNKLNDLKPMDSNKTTPFNRSSLRRNSKKNQTEDPISKVAQANTKLPDPNNENIVTVNETPHFNNSNFQRKSTKKKFQIESNDKEKKSVESVTSIKESTTANTLVDSKECVSKKDSLSVNSSFRRRSTKKKFHETQIGSFNKVMSLTEITSKDCEGEPGVIDSKDAKPKVSPFKQSNFQRSGTRKKMISKENHPQSMNVKLGEDLTHSPKNTATKITDDSKDIESSNDNPFDKSSFRRHSSRQKMIHNETDAQVRNNTLTTNVTPPPNGLETLVLNTLTVSDNDMTSGRKEILRKGSMRKMHSTQMISVEEMDT